jgi:hypothetical protein
MNVSPAPGSLVLLIASLCVIVVGCKSGKPLRKTLPDQPLGSGLGEKIWNKTGGWDGSQTAFSPALPFYAADTTVGGEAFTAIYLHNPDFDSLAAGIVKSYEPFAGSLLNIIAGQGIKGVVLDFRQEESAASQQEANFMVGGQQVPGLPGDATSPIRIIFLWDGLSAARAAGFMNELKSSAMLSVKDINHKNPYASDNGQDCFNPPPPGFGGQ